MENISDFPFCKFLPLLIVVLKHTSYYSSDLYANQTILYGGVYGDISGGNNIVSGGGSGIGTSI